jgi:hypothetical protein
LTGASVQVLPFQTLKAAAVQVEPFHTEPDPAASTFIVKLPVNIDSLDAFVALKVKV